MFVCFRFIEIKIEIYLNVTQNLCYFMSPLFWVLGYTCKTLLDQISLEMSQLVMTSTILWGFN